MVGQTVEIRVVFDARKEQGAGGIMTIYGLGFAAVYLSLLFLYLYAYRLRDALELSELERFDTRYQMCKLLILIGVGLLAAGLAWMRIFLQWSGFTYLLLLPLMRVARVIHQRRRTRLAVKS